MRALALIVLLSLASVSHAQTATYTLLASQNYPATSYSTGVILSGTTYRAITMTVNNLNAVLQVGTFSSGDFAQVYRDGVYVGAFGSGNASIPTSLTVPIPYWPRHMTIDVFIPSCDAWVRWNLGAGWQTIDPAGIVSPGSGSSSSSDPYTAHAVAIGIVVLAMLAILTARAFSS